MISKFANMTSSSIFFNIILFLLSSLVTGPSFMSILSPVLELWQFSFKRDWPEIRKSEIPLPEFCPISGDLLRFTILLINYIADSVTGKLAGIILSSDFLSILSDGSQGREKSSEKEMVQISIKKDGMTCFFIKNIGMRYGTDADLIKRSQRRLKHLHSEPLPLSHHSAKLIGQEI